MSSSTEQDKNEPENVSSSEESDEAKPSANFAIVALKDYYIAEKTSLHFQVNHVIEKPKTKKKPQPKKTWRKAD